MHVLIVDDDDFALDVLGRTLGQMGYTAVTAHDGREALEILRKGEIRLMVTDWDMPGMNGIELCRNIRRQDLSGYVYIVMLTGREGTKQRLEGLCAGADDFLNKPLDPEELLICLKTAERILSLETREVALFALAKLAESRDPATGAHVERVQAYTRLLARNLSPQIKAHYSVDDEYVQLLYQTSPIHDLGKVGIPDAILLKPGKLTPQEFAIMQTHTLIGAQTLDSALRRFPNARFLQMARDIALSHHEKFDGSGYPHGLVGEQIPLCARVVALADVYDALTSSRVYKDAYSHEHAKEEILKGRGSHFDPEVVDAFSRAEQQVISVGQRMRDDSELATTPAVALPTPALRELCATAPGTILLVDDDPAVINKLTELVTATGESVIAAKDGNEAMQIIAARQPKIVISDWVMPGMDGAQLCRQLRSRTDSGPIHFIMLTAHSDKERLLDAYNAGVDDFISKPFDPEELLARVRAGLRTIKLYEESVRRASDSKALNGELATMNSRLERLAITDELTGLFNRRHAMSRLEEQWALAERHSGALTIALIDIDRFKYVNDTHGHDAGDVVLTRVAAILRDDLRGTDPVCRVGGEEFLIIFSGQTVQEAIVCAERCRSSVQVDPFNIHGASIPITISIGIATRLPEMTQFSDLLKAADEALYSAKRAGRNTIHVAEQKEDEAQMTLPSTTTPAMAFASKPCVDINGVLKRCGGDPKFAAAVIERFCKQAPIEVARIETALEANDAEVLRRSAHSLKSMAAYMGAETVSEFARQIEDMARLDTLGEVPHKFVQLRVEVSRAIESTATDALSDLAKCA
jgi:putative two-component system response regulator